MKTSQLILSSSDGSTVYISRAAASLSDVLHRHIDDDSKITITNANGVTLRCLVSAAESIANRVAPGAADPLAAVVECTLRALSLPQQLDVLRTALKLKFHSVARLAAMPLTALLKGRSTEVLRVALDAPDDLTAEEKRIALAESQAQLGVKVQAYQRHNTFLQGELATAESKLATARERIDVLQNELRPCNH